MCGSDGRCCSSSLVNPYFHFVFSLWRISLPKSSSSSAMSGCGSAFGFKVISQLIQLRSQRNSSKTSDAIGRCQQRRDIAGFSSCPTALPAGRFRPFRLLRVLFRAITQTNLMITIRCLAARNCPPNNPRSTIRGSFITRISPRSTR